MSHSANTLAFIQNFGWMEITVIMVVFILFFGAKKLPELARGVGKSIKEFKKATSTIEEDFKTAMDEEVKPEPKRSIPNPQNEQEKTST
ncbi:MAG: twin-arginine translocase TatA/TatE family subunit [Verrucomicrobiota bacterium]